MEEFWPGFPESPPKEFNMCKRTFYTRPDFDDCVSLLDSGVFSFDALEKEKFQRKKLRALVEEQADLNESLADENEALELQQKSLLQLLLSKDKQIDTMINTCSFNTTSPLFDERQSTEATSDGVLVVSRESKMSRVLRVLAYRKVKIALLRWNKSIYQSKIQEFFDESYSYTRYIASLSLYFSLAKIFRRAKHPSLTALKTTGIKLRKTVTRMNIIVNQAVKRPVLRKWFISTQQNTLKTRTLRKLALKFKSRLNGTITKWRIAAGMATIEEVNYDTESEIERIQIITRRFLVLNALTAISSRWEYGCILRRFSTWKNINTKQPSPILALDALDTTLKRIISRRCKILFTKHNPRSLAHTLRRCARERFSQAWGELLAYNTINYKEIQEQNDELSSYNTKLAQQLNETSVTKDKAIKDLEAEINKTSRECTKMSKQLNINQKKIEQQQIEAREERERCIQANHGAGIELQEAQMTIRKYEEQLSTAKKKSRKVDEQNETLKTALWTTKGSLKRSQELYAHSMHEKSRASVCENDYKKQLRSMTNTIDSLAEDKENLLQQITKADDQLNDFNDKLNHQTDANKQLSQQANEAISLHMEKQNQMEDKIYFLENEIRSKKHELNASVSAEATNLKDENGRMRKQVQDLEAKISSEKRKLSQDRQRDIHCNKAEMESKINNFNRELSKLQETANKHKNSNGKLTAQNKALRAELNLVKNEINKTTQDRDGLMRNMKNSQMTIQNQSNIQMRELLDRNKRLESELTNIQEHVMASKHLNTELARAQEDKQRAETELAEVAEAMEECRRQAYSSKNEVERVCAEMENYAQILEAMEIKVSESEERVMIAERRRDEAISEIQAIRQRYINISALK